jgi:glutamate-1-semialdehyde 2,1-aminomutase
MSIEATYLARTPKSAALHAEAQRLIAGGSTRSVTLFAPHPVYMAAGCGCRLRDVDGNEYIDCIGNFASMVHGHAHPVITSAIRDQLTRGTDFGAPTELQLQFARELTARVPSLERVRFTNSGTEAVMFAIRAARAFTGRTKLLKFEGSYHGGYDAVEVSVDPGHDAPAWPLGRAASAGLPPDPEAITLVAPFNDAERAAAFIRSHAGELAAVIVEGVTMRGTIAADRPFVHHLRHVTRELGVLLIMDEIVTFRLAPGGVQASIDVMPDLTTFGKVIGGGLPVGAFGGRADVMDTLDPSRDRAVHHSGTFAGNAATLAGGRAALALLTATEIDRINALGTRLRAGLQDACDGARVPARVTGAGSLATIHFTSAPVRGYRDALTGDRALARRLHLALLNRGIFARSSAGFFLSTAMGEAEIDQTVTAVRDALPECAV